MDAQTASLVDEIHAYMNQAAEQLLADLEELESGVKSILQEYPSSKIPF